MSEDRPNLEPELRKLHAAGLDPSLLDRLEAAAEDRLTELDPLELQFEAELRRFRPRALPPTLLASLEIQSSALPFPETADVVPFPMASPTAAPRRSAWAAAAAVALLGGLAALLLPTTQPGNSGQIVSAPAPAATIPDAASSTPQAAELTPAGFSCKLSETSDEGIIWPSNQRAHRVLKVVYKDLITLKRSDGSSYQIEQPRIEYFIVPTHSD